MFSLYFQNDQRNLIHIFKFKKPSKIVPIQVRWTPKSPPPRQLTNNGSGEDQMTLG